MVSTNTTNLAEVAEQMETHLYIRVFLLNI